MLLLLYFLQFNIFAIENSDFTYIIAETWHFWLNCQYFQLDYLHMMKHIVALIYFSMISVWVSFGQKDQGYLEVKGTVQFEREALADAKVNLYKDGIKDKVFNTDAMGKFVVRLDLNSVYELVFAKQGFFSKKLVFTTKVPSEDVGIWNNKFAVELIPEIEGFDASLFDEPIGKFEFNSKVGDFDYDLVYTTNMQKRIKALMLEYEKARKEAFNKIIAQADAAFNDKSYDAAIEFYNKAIDLVLPKQIHPEHFIQTPCKWWS